MDKYNKESNTKIIMKLTALGLISLLLLTSCSSSPSLEVQTKLIEYEKCLDNAKDQSNLVASTYTRENPFTGGDVTNYTYPTTKTFEALLALCESYRP